MGQEESRGEVAAAPERDLPEPSGGYRAAEEHPFVEAFLEHFCGRRLAREIHPGDSMLDFCRWQFHGDRDHALVHYFYSGWLACQAYERLLRDRFGDRRGLEILDFASGYGRVVRHLVARRPDDRVTVAEVLPQAVAFQRRLLGVEGLVSSADPEDFTAPGDFDAIFVASLFSHLPRHRLEGWLRRLASLLRPGGMLVFSTHGEEVLLPGRALQDDGFYFEGVSETGDLDLAEYGSAWMSEGYTAGLVERCVDGPLSWRRFPRALWHFQDLYVLVREQTDLSTLSARCEPEGYLEGCNLAADGELELRGWAVDHESGEPPEVVVQLAGQERATAYPETVRSDVEARLGSADRPPAGWRVAVPAGGSPIHPDTPLLVTARTAEGARGLLYLGTVHGASLLCRLRDQSFRLDAERLAHHQTAERLDRELATVRQALGDSRRRQSLLEARIAAMEASRFWALRNRWFRIKKALRLVDRVEPGPPLD